MKYLKYTLILLLLPFIGCKKYLDIEPKGKFIPRFIEDYETVLNSGDLLKGFPYMGWVPTDDLNIPVNPGASPTEESNLFLWQHQITNNIENSPAIWGEAYSGIYYANIVLKEVMQAPNGTLEKKKQYYGEALVSRAYANHNLLQFFAKPYDDATAATDLGVPLVTSIDVSEEAPARSTVKQCYDTIIANLETAAAYLPEENINKFRADKYAAYGLLSRVYMSMRKYDKALEYAEKVLAHRSTLLNYNNFKFNEDTYEYEVVQTEVSPEEIWVRYGGYVMGAAWNYYSKELVDLYGGTESDLRIKIANSPEGEDYLIYPPALPNFGISVAEVMLNKAEVLARNSHVQEAMDMVNNIRKNRIVTNDYTALAATNKEEAITKVLEERRRELALKANRWMDMRRLDMENRMPAVKRYDAEGKVIATLEPHSKNYVFQIPLRVTKLNPNIKPNQY